LAENHETGMPEFAAVTCGSFRVRSLRLPRDLSDVIAALRDPDSQVKPVVCAQASTDLRAGHHRADHRATARQPIRRIRRGNRVKCLTEQEKVERLCFDEI